MTTLRQQFKTAVEHAVRVLRTKPKRYKFSAITVPTKAHPCGCLWGLIGEGAGFERGSNIYDVSWHFRFEYQSQLYDAIRAMGAPDSSVPAADWHKNAATAATYLKRAMPSLLSLIPARTEAK